LKYFLERGIFQDTRARSAQKCCIFCRNTTDWINETAGQPVLYSTLVPQYQENTVQESVLICDSCVLKIDAYKDLADFACTDSCKLCHEDYLVEPNEFQSRMEEGRGLHICDACLNLEGFLGYDYLQVDSCPSCRTDNVRKISLTALAKEAKVCENCEVDIAIDRDRGDWETEDEEAEIFAARNQEAIRNARKGIYENIEEKEVKSEPPKRSSSPSRIYKKLNFTPLGHEFDEPENIYICLYETGWLTDRCITFDLVELDSDRLERQSNHKLINESWVTWNLIVFDLNDTNNSDPTHKKYYPFEAESFELIEEDAMNMAFDVLDALKQKTQFDYD